MMDVYQIDSFTNSKIKYYISLNLDYCTCPSFQIKERECKHLKYYKNNKDKLNKLKKLELDLNNGSKRIKKENKKSDNKLDIEEKYIDSYLIKSFNNFKTKYNLSEDLKFCSCPSFEYSENKRCKHIDFYEKNKSELSKFDKEEIILKIID